MSISLSPIFAFGTFLDSSGNPLNGGKLYAYIAGSSSVLQNTYSSTGVANANPITLNSAGRLPVQLFLDAALTYHLVVTQSDGTTIVEEQDNVTSGVSTTLMASFVTDELSAYLPLTGGSITGNIAVSGTSTLGTAQATTLTVSGTSALGVTTVTSVTGALNANSTVVSNVATPVAATDAANKAYADSAGTLPAGMVIYSASTTVPTGWLEANGASLLRASYPALYSAIGVTYGFADGTHFNLPDLRGYFIRGYDDGRGVDAGRVFGSNQADDNKSHTHGLNGQLNNFSLDNIPFFGLTPSGTSDDTGLMDASGTEARPKNIAMLPLIKT